MAVDEVAAGEQRPDHEIRGDHHRGDDEPGNAEVVRRLAVVLRRAGLRHMDTAQPVDDRPSMLMVARAIQLILTRMHSRVIYRI